MDWRKRTIKAIALGGLVISLAVFALVRFDVPTQAATGVPLLLNYQGKLLDDNGNQVSNGSWNFRFSLYDASTGGSQLWSETWNSGTSQVTTVNGVFSATLGTHASLSSVDFSNDTIYLQVELDADGNGVFEETFSARKRLNASPYAFNAEMVDGLHATSTVALANYLLALDANGNLNLFGQGVSSTRVTTTDLFVNRAATTTSLVIGSTNPTVSGYGLFATGSVYAGYFNGNVYTNGNATTTGSLHIGNASLRLEDGSIYQSTGNLSIYTGLGLVHINDDLTVTGTASTTGALHVGTGSGSDDDYIFFDGSSYQSFAWLNSLDQFALSNDLAVTGYASSTVGLYTQGILHVGSTSVFDGSISGSGFNASVNTLVDSRITSNWRGQVNGLASLDASGKVPNSQLSALAISNTFVVDSEAAMLALSTAETGDVAIRTDIDTSFILNGDGDPAVLADWVALLTPTDGVLSVNGQIGAVVLASGDITESSNLYYTDARVDSRIAGQWRGQANGLASLGADGKVPTSQLGSIPITNTFVVASEAAMLALSANTGDVAVRTDTSTTYVLQGSDPTDIDDWVQLLNPASVTSVNGQTGAVTLTTSHITEGSNLYWTNQRFDDRLNATTTWSGNFELTDGNLGIGIDPSYPLEVVGVASTSDEFYIGKNLYVGHASGSDSDVIYFDQGAETLMWNNTAGRFELSDDWYVTGNATTSANHYVGGTIYSQANEGVTSAATGGWTNLYFSASSTQDVSGGYSGIYSAVHAPAGGVAGFVADVKCESASCASYGLRAYSAGAGSSSSHYGVYGEAAATVGTNYGVYGTASGGTTNYAGYFNGDVYTSGNATTTGRLGLGEAISLSGGEYFQIYSNSSGAVSGTLAEIRNARINGDNSRSGLRVVQDWDSGGSGSLTGNALELYGDSNSGFTGKLLVGYNDVPDGSPVATFLLDKNGNATTTGRITVGTINPIVDASLWVSGSTYGVYASSTNATNLVDAYGLFGRAKKTANAGSSYGGYFDANAEGANQAAYGIYANAVGANTGGDTGAYGGYFNVTDIGAYSYGIYVDQNENDTDDFGIYVDSESTAVGGGIYVVDGSNVFLDDVYVGATTESISLAGFDLDGDDLYVEGELGVNSSAYFDSNVEIAGNATTTGRQVVTGNAAFGNAVTGSVDNAGLIFLKTHSAQITNTDLYFGIVATTTFTGLADSGDYIIGTQSSGAFNGTGSPIEVIGVVGLAVNNTANTVTNAVGLYGRIDNQNASGTISNAMGVRALQPQNFGTITNNYGLFVAAVNDTSGTINKNYGIWVGNQTKGSTQNYAIWTNNGQVRLDNSAATTTLYVTGDSVFTGEIQANNFDINGTDVISSARQLQNIASLDVTTIATFETAMEANLDTLSSVTSLGTLSILTVDNIRIDGTTIGHTSDTDLLTFGSNTLTVTAGDETLAFTDGGTDIYLASASGDIYLNDTVYTGVLNSTGVLTVGPTNADLLLADGYLEVCDGGTACSGGLAGDGDLFVEGNATTTKLTIGTNVSEAAVSYLAIGTPNGTFQSTNNNLLYGYMNYNGASSAFGQTLFTVLDSDVSSSRSIRSMYTSPQLTASTLSAGTLTVQGLVSNPTITGTSSITGGTANFYGYQSSLNFHVSTSVSNSPTINYYGFYDESSANIGTTGTTAKYGGYLSITGTADTNYGIYAAASGATTNYAGYFSGNLYVSGNATTTGSLHIGSASLRLEDGSIYQSSGNLTVSTASGLVSISDDLTVSGAATTTGQLVVGSVNPTVGNYKVFVGINDSAALYGQYISAVSGQTNPTGLYASASSTAAVQAPIGVHGYAKGLYTVGGGSAIGVKGEAAPTGNLSGAYGVYGTVTAGGGLASTAYGLYGAISDTVATTNYGVYGTATGGGTTNYGVYGTASGATTNYAGYFNGDFHVQGNATNTGKLVLTSGSPNVDNYKLFVQGSGSSSGNHYGIYSSFADAGSTTNSYAIYGLNSRVNGSSTRYGVYGEASGSGAVSYGIYGTASGATTNYGGRFNSAGETAYGLYVTGSGTTNAFGIYSLASDSTNDSFGLYAETNSAGTAGYGVVGSASGAATTNYGVYGTASGGTTNYAGYFGGDVVVVGASGDVTLQVSNSVDYGSLDGATTHYKNLYQGNFTPTLSVNSSGGGNTVNLYGDQLSVATSNITFGYVTGANTTNLHGSVIAISGNPTIDDNTGANSHTFNMYGQKVDLTVTPTVLDSNDAGFIQTSYGGYFNNSSVGPDALDGTETLVNYGVYGQAAGDLTTSASSATHYGGYFSGTGSANTNYGIYATASGATTNYAGYFSGKVYVDGNFEVFPAGSGRTSGAVRVVDRDVTIGIISSTAGDSTVFTVENRAGTDFLVVDTPNAKTYINTGNFGVGDSTPLSLFTVGSGDKFRVDGSGNVTSTANLTVTGLSTNTTGSAANVFVDANGLLFKSTSSARYKTNINYSGVDGNLLYDLRPATFTHLGDGQEYLGFIAEDVALVEPRLVVYDEQGRPDSVHYANITSLLVATVKDQKQQLDALELTVSSFDNSAASSTPLTVIDTPQYDIDTLVVRQAATFYGTITVIGEAFFEHDVVFARDVEINGKLYVTADQAGSLVVPTGATSTEVIFAGEYLVVPKVVASLTDLAQITFAITEKTTLGFRLSLLDPANQDLHFDWIALATKTVAGEPPVIDDVVVSLTQVAPNTPVELWAKVTDPDTDGQSLHFSWKMTPAIGSISGNANAGLVYWTVDSAEVTQTTDVTVEVSVTDGGRPVTRTTNITVVVGGTNGQVAGTDCGPVSCPTDDSSSDDTTSGATSPAGTTVAGCTDSSADNYNALADTDDGSCTYPPTPVLGCTDSSADNYDSSATQDDGSCTFPTPVTVTPPTPDPVPTPSSTEIL